MRKSRWEIRVLAVPFWVLLAASSCATRRPPEAFRVLPAQPSYVLRSPDRAETPFPEVLAKFTGVGSGWVDLQPQMGLQVENAYFREGAPRKGIEGFVGTEVARYRVPPHGGLRLISVESKVAARPKDQGPVQELVPDALARYRYHRFFYQVAFRSKGDVHGAVLLGARSASELKRLSTRLLADPDAVCGRGQALCAVFPEVCTVSLEMEIVVNGEPRTVSWGSWLGNIVARPRRVELLRRYAGRLTPVEIDVEDANTLRLPLLPGDQVTWE